MQSPGGRTETALRSAEPIAVSHQGRARRYLLYVPAAPTGALVLAFHGGGQTAPQQEETSGFDALADREHFIVAYPEAMDRSWADGRNTTIAEKAGVDDVGFARRTAGRLRISTRAK